MILNHINDAERSYNSAFELNELNLLKTNHVLKCALNHVCLEAISPEIAPGTEKKTKIVSTIRFCQLCRL